MNNLAGAGIDVHQFFSEQYAVQLVFLVVLDPIGVNKVLIEFSDVSAGCEVEFLIVIKAVAFFNDTFESRGFIGAVRIS